ncbi:hypothetical protein C805_02886 [Eubacterium sp. 14-2]|uniref:hypothetical protein n=1 Tax=Eubacterium sp. 14-2 TaxID=1235790 RepID=UPI0003388D4D|nr:hypothetical protein C805_02886 [Eubacterium sp. 14-2]
MNHSGPAYSTIFTVFYNYYKSYCYFLSTTICSVSRPEYVSLSEEFFNGEDCAVDVKVKMIYDGKDNDIISQYVTFTKVYDEQVKLYRRTREAVTNTINICKDRNVLKEYPGSREKEVVDMMMTLFDDEQVMRAYVFTCFRNDKKGGWKI